MESWPVLSSPSRIFVFDDLKISGQETVLFDLNAARRYIRVLHGSEPGAGGGGALHVWREVSAWRGTARWQRRVLLTGTAAGGSPEWHMHVLVLL